MVDNVAITPGTGATIAADDIGGVLYQRVKLSLGADGTANDASAGAGAVGTGTQRVTLASDDPLVTLITTQNGYLDGLEGFSDGLEGLITSTNSLLTAQAGYVDGLETLLTTQAGYLDGVETLIGTTNTSLTTMIGHVDGVETLIGTTNTTLTAIDGRVDGLEGQVGIVTEAAPGTDTASSGLNGRLQRLAQRLTSLIALLPASLGIKTAAASLSVTQASLEYEVVAASATDQALGATGAAGDYLSHIVIQPATTAAGTVTVKDNSTVIYTFTSGTLADLRSIIVPIGAISSGGSWKITTGTNVAVLAFGDFT